MFLHTFWRFFSKQTSTCFWLYLDQTFRVALETTDFVVQRILLAIVTFKATTNKLWYSHSAYKNAIFGKCYHIYTSMRSNNIKFQSIPLLPNKTNRSVILWWFRRGRRFVPYRYLRKKFVIGCTLENFVGYRVHRASYSSIQNWCQLVEEHTRMLVEELVCHIIRQGVSSNQIP